MLATFKFKIPDIWLESIKSPDPSWHYGYYKHTHKDVYMYYLIAIVTLLQYFTID